MFEFLEMSMMHHSNWLVCAAAAAATTKAAATLYEPKRFYTWLLLFNLHTIFSTKGLVGFNVIFIVNLPSFSFYLSGISTFLWPAFSIGRIPTAAVYVICLPILHIEYFFHSGSRDCVIHSSLLENYALAHQQWANVDFSTEMRSHTFLWSN